MASTASSKREAIAKAEMLIRKPVSEVFAAFTEPEMITNSGWPGRAAGSSRAPACIGTSSFTGRKATSR
jgi:hypothetical protein